MTPTDSEVQREVLDMVRELAEDWEYDGELTPDTKFVAEMGLESLDIVVLGTMVQHRYGRLPFTEWLAEIGERPVEERDVTPAELAAFVCRHRQPGVVEAH